MIGQVAHLSSLHWEINNWKQDYQAYDENNTPCHGRAYRCPCRWGTPWHRRTAGCPAPGRRPDARPIIKYAACPCGCQKTGSSLGTLRFRLSLASKSWKALLSTRIHNEVRNMLLGKQTPRPWHGKVVLVLWFRVYYGNKRNINALLWVREWLRVCPFRQRAFSLLDFLIVIEGWADLIH